MEHDNYISEGYAIGFNHDGEDDDDENNAFLDYHELTREEYDDLSRNVKRRLWGNYRLLNNHITDKCVQRINSMQGRYDSNKTQSVGSMISCAGCGKSITKKSYQSQFCRNKGRGNCKDKFWNLSTDKRRNRALFRKKCK